MLRRESQRSLRKLLSWIATLPVDQIVNSWQVMCFRVTQKQHMFHEDKSLSQWHATRYSYHTVQLHHRS